MTSVVFAASATVSSALDLTAYGDIGRQRVNSLVFPSGWVSGTVSLQSSSDLGATYQPVYLPSGTLYSVTAGAGDEVMLDFGVMAPLTNIKLVSSTAQTASPTVTVILVDPQSAAGLGSSGSGGGGGSVTLVGSAMYTGQFTVGTAASQVSGTSQTLVTGMTIENNGTSIFYVGGSSSVTTSTGYPVPVGGSVSLPVNNSNIPYAIAGTAGQAASWLGI